MGSKSTPTQSPFPHLSSVIKLLLLSLGNGGGVKVREDRSVGGRKSRNLREAQGLATEKEAHGLGKREVGTLVEEETFQVRLSDLANLVLEFSFRFSKINFRKITMNFLVQDVS